jgi:hypothetical protein
MLVNSERARQKHDQYYFQIIYAPLGIGLLEESQPNELSSHTSYSKPSQELSGISIYLYTPKERKKSNFPLQHPLLLQRPAHHNSEQHQITKRYNGQPIGMVYAKNISEFSLDGWNDGATEDHHHQET